MDGQDALIQRMNEIDWFHSIPLKDGIVTPGRDDSMSKLKQVCLPEDLSGKSVLDIGAWDGFFSFQAERNGAERVLATDHYSWSGPGWGSNEGFKFAHFQRYGHSANNTAPTFFVRGRPSIKRYVCRFYAQGIDY